MKNPLMRIGKILRIYSWIGLFPAHIDQVTGEVTLQWWRYLPQLVPWVAYAILMSAIYQFSNSDECLGQNMTWKNLSESLSGFDLTVTFANIGAFVFFGNVVLFLHHKALRKYNDLVALCKTLPEAKDTGRGPMLHHLMAIAVGAFSGILIVTGTNFNLGISITCTDSLIYLMFSMLTQMSGSAFLTMPELIFVTFAQTVTASIKTSLSNYSKTGDLSQFCSEQKKYFQVISRLEAVFGPLLLVSIASLTIILTVSAYFGFASIVMLFGSTKEASFTWFALQLLSVVIASKRLLHITDYAQMIFFELDQVTIKLILSDVSASTDWALAVQTKMLLDRLNGGIPIMGFFTLKRGILLAIISNMLTYVIILVEFRLNQ